MKIGEFPGRRGRGRGRWLYRPRRKGGEGRDAGGGGDAARFKGGRTLPGNLPAASLLDHRRHRRLP